MRSVVAIKPFARRRPWSVVTLALALVVCAIAGVQVVSTLASSFDLGFGLVLVLPRVLELGLVVFGLVLIAKGMPYRYGPSLHCARCGYQRVEERDRLLINCPECGNHWRLFGGWRIGKPLGSQRLVTIGLLVCTAGLAAITARGLAARWLAEQMTTGMLIRHVLYAPTDATLDSWDILSRRAMTATQVRWLAEDLLRRRRDRGSLDGRAVGWFHARLADGSIDPELAARYYEESADFWIDAPTSVSPGQNFEASLRGLYRGPAFKGPEGEISFAIEGISVELPSRPADDKATEFERKFRSGPSLIGPVGVSRQLADPMEARRPARFAEVSASGQFTGKATVRAVVWVLVGPDPYDAVTWTGQGRGIVPRTVFNQARSYRREIVREVDIFEFRR